MFKAGEMVRCKESCYSRVKKYEVRKVIAVGGGERMAIEGGIDGFNYFMKDFELVVPVRDFIPGDIVKVIDTTTPYKEYQGFLKLGNVLVVTNGNHKYFSGDDFYSIGVRAMKGSQICQDIPVSCVELIRHEKEHWLKEAYDKAKDSERIPSCKECIDYKCSPFAEPCVKCRMRSLYRQDKADHVFGASLYNVVFVTHDDDAMANKRRYLFRTYRTHIKGDKLFADTKNGKKLVTAATGSFLIDRDGLDAMDLMNGCHKGELKSITGYAQKQEEWKEVPFK